MSFKTFLSDNLKKVQTTFGTAKEAIKENVVVPKPISTAASATNTFGKSIANGLASFAVSAGEAVPRIAADVVAKTTGNETAQKMASEPTAPKQIPGPVGRWVGPIKSYQSKAIEEVQAGSSVPKAVAKGALNVAIDEPIGFAAKPVVAVGGLIFKEGAEKLLKPTLSKIAESKSATQIAEYLGGIVKGTKEQIDNLSSRLVSVSSQNEVKNTIDKMVSEAIDTIPGKEKVSQFANRVSESGKFDPIFSEDLKNVIYSVTSNKETIQKAEDIMSSKPIMDVYSDFRNAFKLSDDGKKVVDNMTPEMNVVGIKLIDKLQELGKYDEIFNVIEQVSQSATKKGQEIQALAMFSRVSPEGIINYATKRLNRAGLSLDEIKNVMTPQFMDELKAMSNANKMVESGTRQRAVADALLLKMIDDKVPVSGLHKLASAQTIAMLLNPKTITRNIIGNAGLNAAEGVAHNVFSTPIDILTSVFTGKRSRTFSDIGSAGKGFVQGLKEGSFEGWNKIDLKKLDTAYDYRNGTFKTGLMDKFERALGVGLKGPDRAFYQASYDSTMANQLKTWAINSGQKYNSVEDLIKVVPEKQIEKMQEVAHYAGMYRTFQDPSALSESLVMIKKGLNLNKGFGMGDALLKFPRTPANLINRGLAYSPAGFVKVIMDGAAPLIGKSKFNQKEFVESFGRAMTGTTGLVGTGYLLHSLGVVTGGAPESKDLGATQRTTGLGQFKINVSALKRLALSMDPNEAKMKEGDTMYSYDWFQPLAIGISIGANLSELNKGGNAENSFFNLVGSVASGVDTVGDQPLFKGITQKFMYNKNMSDVIKDVAKDVPASFIPTLSKQIRDLVDENQRETYSPNIANETFNKIKNKIPGASKTMPPTVDVLGNDIKTYQDGSYSVFNVMFNPGFVTHYKPSEEAKMVIDLFNETGSASALPNSINKKITINGESHKLTPEEYYNMRKIVGVLAQRALYTMSQDEVFTSMPPSEQAKAIGNNLSDIGAAAKILLLDNKPKRIDSGTVKVLDYYIQNREELQQMLIRPNVEN